MKKSSKNIIQKKVDSNYGLISNETKENLLRVSNAIFTNEKNV